VRAEIIGNLEALRSATTVAAEIVQHTGKLGVIQPGAIADLLVVRGNPLRDIAVLTGQGEGIAAILKDGKFVKNELTAHTSTAPAN
jgi:imidazolonepropionase-like amidohydrolase